MVLIGKELKFDTNIMDIAHLMMLKIQKRPEFVPDINYVKLSFSVLVQKADYKGAIKLLEEKKALFENQVEMQTLLAKVHYMSGEYLKAINTYFKVLKPNSKLNSFRKLWPLYDAVVKITLNDLLPKSGYTFVQDANDVFVDIAGVYSHNNFDELKPNSTCFEVLRMLFHSLRNLRKIPNFDATNAALSANADFMRRTSLLAELELHYNYAL